MPKIIDSWYGRATYHRWYYLFIGVMCLIPGMMAWSAITTGKGLGREEITGLFAKSRFNRKYSTFSWCEEDLAVADVSEVGCLLKSAKFESDDK